jgi:hypothetical protein
MTTLTEFLSTADADSATALVQARAFSEQVLKPLDERMMNERTADLFVDDAYGVVGAG